MTPGRVVGIPVSLIVVVGVTVGVVSKRILVGVYCAVRVSVAVGSIEVAPVEGYTMTGGVEEASILDACAVEPGAGALEKEAPGVDSDPEGLDCEGPEALAPEAETEPEADSEADPVTCVPDAVSVGDPDIEPEADPEGVALTSVEPETGVAVPLPVGTVPDGEFDGPDADPDGVMMTAVVVPPGIIVCEPESSVVVIGGTGIIVVKLPISVEMIFGVEMTVLIPLGPVTVDIGTGGRLELGGSGLDTDTGGIDTGIETDTLTEVGIDTPGGDGGRDTETGGTETDTGGTETDTGGTEADTGGTESDTGGTDTDTGGIIDDGTGKLETGTGKLETGIGRLDIGSGKLETGIGITPGVVSVLPGWLWPGLGIVLCPGGGGV